jgi:fido (protein-threonine AMPylation protein)
VESIYRETFHVDTGLNLRQHLVGGRDATIRSGVDRSIRTRKQLNAAEAANIAGVVYRYLLGGLASGEAPFDRAWILELHREMFGRVWSWAGQPRRINVNLGCPWHEYLAAVRAADAMDFRPLTELHARYSISDSP